MNNIGLVLEGGGMRGIFTAGVLDFFMENEIHFNYVIGVSAGACNGMSYISKQIGRSKRTYIDYIEDSRYISLTNLYKEKSLFGMDFIFQEIPNKLIPFDFEEFYSSKISFVVGTTNCKTGNAEYFNKNKFKRNFAKIVRASSSLPYVSPTVKIKDNLYLDGGISAPIPIKKSIEDDNYRNVIILTRPRGYVKRISVYHKLARVVYRKHKKLAHALSKRYIIYNNMLKYINKLEKEGRVFVIAPSEDIKISRIEKDKNKLEALYNEGYIKGSQYSKKLYDWMKYSQKISN